MIPADLEIITPVSLQEALELKDQYGSQLTTMAAGTDILVQIRNGLLKPPRLMNILKLKSEIGVIKEELSAILVGALTTHTEIENSRLIQTYAPALARGSAYLGSPQIRNRGTIGGNVCNASPAGDTIAPLFVHNAEAIVLSKNHARVIPMSKLFAGPLEVDLKPEEILSHFRIPKEHGFQWFLERLSQRKALACNKVSVAGVLWIDGLKIAEIRLAFGSVSPIVRRAHKTEKILKSHDLSKESIEEAAKMICTEVEPIDDFRSTKEYRRAMTGQLLKKSLRNLLKKTAN
ncbi:MAG: FAD binding domain-containing protein [Candidatus Hodarchaeota archaeon]